MWLLVTTGGRLFEYYLSFHAPYEAHNKWMDIKGRNHPDYGGEDRDDIASSEEQEELLEKTQRKFHGFLISSVSTIGNNGKRQMFFHTFMAKYCGLSNSGSEAMSQLGFTMKRTSYIRCRHEVLQQALEQTKYTI